MKMYGMEGFAHLKEEKYVPQPVPEFMEEGSVFEKAERRRYPASSSLPDLRTCGAVYKRSRQGSGRAGDQADSLPCQRQFPHYRGIGPGGGKREAGFCTGGAEGPV